MATTTNFGWTTPDDTDLVKDGAAAIRTLGSAIDTSLVDLKGGTTGQVLAKASNTDMDFTWATDASGIPATIFDAKGDLIAASAADTAARLAVGTNGQVLTADSGESTGLKWATPAAGSLTLINTGGTSLSGASTTISSIPTTYKALRVELIGVRPATDAVRINMRFNSDTGSNYTMSSSDTTGQSIGATSWFPVDDMDNGDNKAFYLIDLPNYADTASRKFGIVSGVSSNATTPTNVNIRVAYGVYNSLTAITSITVLPSSGNFNASGGTIYVYGVN